jgi:hypothetical protein
METMNSKNVLNKIMTLLALETKEEVSLAIARLGDGTVLESPSFDVGESVEVVAEDGSKSPAPNGEHELVLRDEEGNETRFKIFVTDGVITERENIEELEDSAETVEVEKLPETMAEEVIEEEEEKEEVTINLEDLPKIVEEMSYRIEELEKKIAEMQEEKVEEEVEAEEEEVETVEEELSVPKLDGAPTESIKKLMNKKGSASPQASFLSKLYNN